MKDREIVRLAKLKYHAYYNVYKSRFPGVETKPWDDVDTATKNTWIDLAGAEFESGIRPPIETDQDRINTAKAALTRWGTTQEPIEDAPRIIWDLLEIIKAREASSV